MRGALPQELKQNAGFEAKVGKLARRLKISTEGKICLDFVLTAQPGLVMFKEATRANAEAEGKWKEEQSGLRTNNNLDSQASSQNLLEESCCDQEKTQQLEMKAKLFQIRP